MTGKTIASLWLKVAVISRLAPEEGSAIDFVLAVAGDGPSREDYDWEDYREPPV